MSVLSASLLAALLALSGVGIVSALLLLGSETPDLRRQGRAWLSPVWRRPCPACQQHALRRSHRRNILERLASRLGGAPVRCDECGYRFWIFWWQCVREWK
jgi:predicted RNA-binding Zn-ribbon protein involved in translation (DUF1610 family)